MRGLFVVLTPVLFMSPVMSAAYDVSPTGADTKAGTACAFR
jgi:hypothetical protein